MFVFQNKKSKKSGKRDSDPRPQPWQGCALPTELFSINWKLMVKRRRLELPRRNWHYPLKVARLPIPPPLHQVHWITCEEKRVPRTGLEPARLAAHAPETCASTNSATWAFLRKGQSLTLFFVQKVERKTGLGPATPTLARLCSTNWAISAFSSLFGRHLSRLRMQRYDFFPNCQNFLAVFFKKTSFSVLFYFPKRPTPYYIYSSSNASR